MATSIGATIRTGREIQCLPYAEFFFLCLKILTDPILERGSNILLLTPTTTTPMHVTLRLPRPWILKRVDWIALVED